MPLSWSLEPSCLSDGTWIAELRADVMRADLQRLGLYDEVWVRQRFLRAFHPEHTNVIRVQDRPAGSIAVRPEPDCQWIEHFYLPTEVQGDGVGTAVLAHVLHSHRDERPFRLNLLRGSCAAGLYQRAGFVFRLPRRRGRLPQADAEPATTPPRHRPQPAVRDFAEALGQRGPTTTSAAGVLFVRTHYIPADDS
jgi:GNAT superfamily N-acetyltransferase